MRPPAAAVAGMENVDEVADPVAEPIWVAPVPEAELAAELEAPDMTLDAAAGMITMSRVGG